MKMRVSGEKQRVRLTEADLEPSPTKPVVRVAPLAAAAVWIASTVLATGIYLEWLPVSQLFEPAGEAGTSERRSRRSGTIAQVRQPATGSPQLPVAPEPDLRASVPLPVEDDAKSQNESPRPKPVKRSAESDGANDVARGTAAQESRRMIRGTYHTDNTHWVGGW